MQNDPEAETTQKWKGSKIGSIQKWEGSQSERSKVDLRIIDTCQKRDCVGPEAAMQPEWMYAICGRTKSGKETGLDTVILIVLCSSPGMERHSLMWKFVALIGKNPLPGGKGVENSQ